MAVVVRREPASSAQLGNTALITRGRRLSWMAGRQLHSADRRARSDGGFRATASPRLISLSPDPDRDRRPGLTTFPMTCHSGGSVDIYLEPVLPAPRSWSLGSRPRRRRSPVSARSWATRSLRRSRRRSRRFPDADRLIDDRRRRGMAAVAARAAVRGRGDARAARRRSDSGSARPRARLSGRRRQPQALRTNAGDARGARRDAVGTRLDRESGGPRHRRPRTGGSGAQHPGGDRPDAKGGRSAAGRHELATAQRSRRARPRLRHDRDRRRRAHRAEHAGRTYYFCCGGCRERFLAAPDRYGAAAVS